MVGQWPMERIGGRGILLGTEMSASVKEERTMALMMKQSAAMFLEIDESGWEDLSDL